MQFTKHIHVLHLLSTIPATDTSGRSPVSVKDATDAFDHLFSYIHAHWVKPMSSGYMAAPTAVEKQEFIDCRTMLDMNHEELTAKLETLPPYFREEIFPVAIARYMLRDLRLKVDHRWSSVFMEFHSRYGNMILSSF